MRNSLFIKIVTLTISLLTTNSLFAQTLSEDEILEKSDTYKVVGAGNNQNEAEMDAYQNAIIEFFKNNLTPEDIKTNSSKLLKEFFNTKKIKSYIKSSKIISKDNGDKFKLVIEVSINTRKVIESLNNIGIKMKSLNEIGPKPKPISNNVSDLIPLNNDLENTEFLSELEIEIIKELNLARSNPKLYAEYLKEYRKYYDGHYLKIPGQIMVVTKEGVTAIDEAIKELFNYEPLKPLKISKGLSLAAKDHVNDTGKIGTTGHNGSDGSSPFGRMNRYGKCSYCGENINYGDSKSRDIVISLIIDDGVPSRGHRKNIFNSNFNVVGVAFGSHSVYGYMCVIDFADEYEEKK